MGSLENTKRGIKRKHSSDSESSSESGSSDSDSDNDQSQSDLESKPNLGESEVDSWRSDPLGKLQKHQWELTEGPNAFVNKYFVEYMSEGTLKKSILKKTPKLLMKY